jgi:hypothetical protein
MLTVLLLLSLLLFKQHNLSMLLLPLFLLMLFLLMQLLSCSQVCRWWQLAPQQLAC